MFTVFTAFAVLAAAELSPGATGVDVRFVQRHLHRGK